MKKIPILRISLTLLIITGTLAALLAGINAITAGNIEKQDQRKLQAAIQEVLPGATNVQPISFQEDSSLVTALYGTAEGNFAVQVAPAGFGGEITMMVGLTSEGEVLGVSIIDHSETPGLGAVAGADNAKGQAFRDQFTGHDGSFSLKKDGGDIDALTGATVTSQAIVEGINAAQALVKEVSAP